MSLSGCRDFILQYVPSRQERVGNQIMNGVRRGSDVVAAAETYLRSHGIRRQGISTSDLASVVVNDLLRAQVIALASRGRYAVVERRSNCFILVRTRPPRTLRGLRSGLPWSRRV